MTDHSSSVTFTVPRVSLWYTLAPIVLYMVTLLVMVWFINYQLNNTSDQGNFISFITDPFVLFIILVLAVAPFLREFIRIFRFWIQVSRYTRDYTVTPRGIKVLYREISTEAVCNFSTIKAYRINPEGFFERIIIQLRRTSSDVTYWFFDTTDPGARLSEARLTVQIPSEYTRAVEAVVRQAQIPLVIGDYLEVP